jgi:hypothetical protein
VGRFLIACLTSGIALAGCQSKVEPVVVYGSTETSSVSTPTFESIPLANDAADGYITLADFSNINPLSGSVVGSGYALAEYKITPANNSCSDNPTYGATIPLSNSTDFTSDGSYKICVRLSGTAGTSPAYGSSAAFVVDRSVPGFIGSTPYTTPASPNSNTTPIVTFSVSEAATVTLYSNSSCSSAISSATAVTSTPGQSITTTGIPVAATTIYGKAVDSANNGSSCASLTSYTNFMRFTDPNPSSGNGFGETIVELKTGNIVITSPTADINGVTNSGAVYLFNGVTGDLISTLYGSTSNDQVGREGVTALANGNFVVLSRVWDCTVALCPSPAIAAVVSNVGAATWGSGTTGISGPVSSLNSLVGSTAGDQVGESITALTNGNYVTYTIHWNCTVTLCPSPAIAAAVTDVGAATWGSGTTGISGPVSSTNSLVGSTSHDEVGSSTVTALSNGSYVVRSSSWSFGTVASVGAATWGSGTAGISGPVSSTNSLVGSTAMDQVGSAAVTALTNGNYVVVSQRWNCTTALCLAPAIAADIADVGAVTWGSGSAGISGPVSSANSLVGSTVSDNVGGDGVVALTNGNYVVASASWDCAVTNGCSGGAIANAGAVTWGSGTTGINGSVSSANSLVGSTENDGVGKSITPLTNGNYVVRSSFWDCTSTLCPLPAANATVANAGAITWGSGTTGISGPVTSTNSLVGSTADDKLGSGWGGVIALTNGNYVVPSDYWDCTATLCLAPAIAALVADVGAVTWGSGTSGITGPVSSGNSLVGSTASDQIGNWGLTALPNGNYVVASASWDCTATLCLAPAIAALVANVGAVTWGSGTTGISGPVSSANSLVGSSANDQAGYNGVTPLTNGSYVVATDTWDCTSTLCPAPAIHATVANVGAATFGSGTAGISGPVNSTNSLVGSTANDKVGAGGSTGLITALTNGNYIVSSPNWDCAVTNGCPAGALVNAGAVTWGSGTIGVAGPVSSSNSFIGGLLNDQLGDSTSIALSNSNYLFKSSFWGATDMGLVIGISGASVAAGILVE